MGIEGQIVITLQCRDDRVAAVDVASSRPLQAPRVFIGRGPAEVLDALPRIYSLCATAQAVAARRALAAAAGMEADAVDAAAGLLVDLETVREHALGVLLGWAQSLNEPPDPAAAGLVRLLPQARGALFPGGFGLEGGVVVERPALDGVVAEMRHLLESAVFTRPLEAWQAQAGIAELEHWARAGRTVAARTLAMALALPPRPGAGPPLIQVPAAERLDTALAAPDADAFIARPEWQGAPAETSSLTRQADHPLVRALRADRGTDLATRLAARLVELAATALAVEAAAGQVADGRASTPPTAPAGTGIGQVEAARGRLIHRVELDDGRVARYQVLAPTEWNFHPRGAAVSALRGLTAADPEQLHRWAALTVRAVDPCVAFELRID